MRLTTTQGLIIVPGIVPPEVQKIVLRHLIHRDLSDPRHQTNLHLHYHLPYPRQTGDAESFFSYPPSSQVRFDPKDPSVHKALSIKQVLERRLSWVTLGGQYDWSNRVYPGEKPPEFPPDIASFLETLFPETLAQAAIVNFYTPGDTMMMHRDVSEETDKGLVSLSIGCDSLFMIAPNGAEREGGPSDGKKYLLLRLRSGDAIYMTKEARFAWHGVPKVLKGTCPSFLEDWPAEDGKYEEWRGWMRNKRINLNVRQMKE
jgi:DNA alkylation damage repair protein AlkB